MWNDKRRRRRRKYGIWLDNKFKVKIHGKKWIKPISKICQRCQKRRVLYHHKYCNPCWDFLHGKDKINQQTTTIFLNPEPLSKESDRTSEQHDKNKDIQQGTIDSAI